MLYRFPKNTSCYPTSYTFGLRVPSITETTKKKMKLEGVGGTGLFIFFNCSKFGGKKHQHKNSYFAIAA